MSRRRGQTFTLTGPAANAFVAAALRHDGDHETADRIDPNVCVRCRFGRREEAHRFCTEFNERNPVSTACDSFAAREEG